MSDLEGMKLMPVDTTWDNNREIFAECIALGCIPMTTEHIRGKDYYFIHHEQVVRYHQEFPYVHEEDGKLVMDWLHSHHRLVLAYKRHN